MVEVLLGASYLDGGIAAVDFFNGRVLTAEDLRDQQAAEAARHRRLGRAAGPGVVSGFTVARGADGRSLEITAGLAVTAAGDVIELAADRVRVPLSRPVTPAAGGPSGQADFTDCAGPETPMAVPGQGVYVLAVSPASGGRGQAPRVAYDAGGVARDCGPRYQVAGLSFHLLAVDLAGLAAAGGLDVVDMTALTGGDALLRNVLAHLFLGTVAARNVIADPLGAGTGPSALDRLRSEGRLTPADVALAVFTWAGGSVDVVDRWAVRRAPVHERIPSPPWTSLIGAARAAVSEAVFLQFHQHLYELTGPIRARDHFRYLPAAGLVPASDTFFDGIRVRPPVTISAGAVERLLRESLTCPPLDLRHDPALYLYEVRENQQAGAASYLVFASADLPDGDEGPEILAIHPSGPLRTGQSIQIRGRRFDWFARRPPVSFDGTEAMPADGSTDRKLLVTVPPKLDVPEEGRTCTLTVTSGRGTDSVPVVVIPGQPPLKGVLVLEAITPLLTGPLGPAVTAMRFRLTSQLDRAADVSLRFEVTPDRLRPLLVLTDDDGGPLPRETLFGVAPGEHRDFGLRRVGGRVLMPGNFAIVLTAVADEITVTWVGGLEHLPRPPR
ncbi:IPT/TIG domain-containing protein [Nonomuraea angiospora]|uniref:IPT/TIG domain-containing protein n=1 Tax=Nonomuraea angiospora TaxID=46172 RepID=UPI00340330DA